MAARHHRWFGRYRCCSPGRGIAGVFLVPLASLASLVLLLGCLSMQSVALQNARRLAALARLRQAEDSLMSAAQLLVARLQSQHRCLLPLALARWSAGGCASTSQLSDLARGEVDSVPYQLLAWQPQANAALPAVAGPDGAELLLELRPRHGEPALRSAFAVGLEGSPSRVRDLRLLGLRGTAP